MRRLGTVIAGLDAGVVEQALGSEDGCMQPQGERDAVGRAGIDLERMVVAVNQQFGEVGILADGADDHPAE